MVVYAVSTRLNVSSNVTVHQDLQVTDVKTMNRHRHHRRHRPQEGTATVIRTLMVGILDLVRPMTSATMGGFVFRFYTHQRIVTKTTQLTTVNVPWDSVVRPVGRPAR